MNAKKIKTLGCGCLCLVLLVVLYFGVQKYNQNRESAEKKAEETKEKASIVLSLAPDQIQSISFEHDQQKVVLEKTSQGWRSPEEEAFCGDDSRIDVLLKDVAALKAERVIEEVKDPETYGLTNSAVVIEIQSEEKVRILVGNKNGSNKETYFSMGDSTETVYLTKTDLARDFSGMLKDFYQYEVFPAMKPEQIREIHVKKPECSYEIVMPGDDQATVRGEDGITERGNLNLLGNIQNQLSNISWLSNEEFDCDDYSKYGLDSEKVILDVRQGNIGSSAETYEEHVLWIGSKDSSGNYYACLENSGEIHTIRREYLETLVEGEAASFWSLAYSYVSIGDLENLEVTYGGKTYLLKRISDGKGQEEENLTWLVDDQKVEKKPFTDFYYACVSVSAQERLTEVPAYEEEPVLALHYYLADGSEKELKYYQADQNFYTVIYENGTKAASTNKLYVNEMISKFETLLAEAGKK